MQGTIRKLSPPFSFSDEQQKLLTMDIRVLVDKSMFRPIADEDTPLAPLIGEVLLQPEEFDYGTFLKTTISSIKTRLQLPEREIRTYLDHMVMRNIVKKSSDIYYIDFRSVYEQIEKLFDQKMENYEKIDEEYERRVLDKQIEFGIISTAPNFSPYNEQTYKNEIEQMRKDEEERFREKRSELLYAYARFDTLVRPIFNYIQVMRRDQILNVFPMALDTKPNSKSMVSKKRLWDGILHYEQLDECNSFEHATGLKWKTTDRRAQSTHDVTALRDDLLSEWDEDEKKKELTLASRPAYSGKFNSDLVVQLSNDAQTINMNFQPMEDMKMMQHFQKILKITAKNLVTPNPTPNRSPHYLSTTKYKIFKATERDDGLSVYKLGDNGIIYRKLFRIHVELGMYALESSPDTHSIFPQYKDFTERRIRPFSTYKVKKTGGGVTIIFSNSNGSKSIFIDPNEFDLCWKEISTNERFYAPLLIDSQGDFQFVSAITDP